MKYPCLNEFHVMQTNQHNTLKAKQIEPRFAIFMLLPYFDTKFNTIKLLNNGIFGFAVVDIYFLILGI